MPASLPPMAPSPTTTGEAPARAEPRSASPSPPGPASPSPTGKPIGAAKTAFTTTYTSTGSTVTAPSSPNRKGDVKSGSASSAEVKPSSVENDINMRFGSLIQDYAEEGNIYACLEYLTRPHTSWKGAARVAQLRQEKIDAHESAVLARAWSRRQRRASLNDLDSTISSTSSRMSVASAPSGFPSSAHNRSNQLGQLRPPGRLPRQLEQDVSELFASTCSSVVSDVRTLSQPRGGRVIRGGVTPRVPGSLSSSRSLPGVSTDQLLVSVSSSISSSVRSSTGAPAPPVQPSPAKQPPRVYHGSTVIPTAKPEGLPLSSALLGPSSTSTATRPNAKPMKAPSRKKLESVEPQRAAVESFMVGGAGLKPR